ncbi:LysM peptidoglycan-binding domain-containing protein [Staphylococcus pettenkoferi]|uniref:CHAP domain-containing protein n=1 Tax=Staphylococcus pettenkoferi TaxID=170573 RepID=UPI001C8CA2B2|nr:CHAP domain-containing protein [Staphylococcus pettenkoferi]MBX8992793.1 LysM peptidoglycan-binding domain-containing protein [Staphylococcus pettenkoferi]
MKKTITLSAVSSAALFFGIHGVASADQVHTVKDDAQLSDIASTFATNSNELKSLNNINSNSVNAGTDLIIPDVDIYEVKAGDSIQGIASAHDLTVEQLYQLNPYLGDVIHPGDLLALSEKGSAHLYNLYQAYSQGGTTYASNSNYASYNANSSAPSYNANSGAVTQAPATQSAPTTGQTSSPASYTQSYTPTASQSYTTSTKAPQASQHYSAPATVHHPASTNAANSYSWGYCTYYAFERRQQLGRGIGNYWGNANNWANAAQRNGYTVNRTPEVGAVFQTTAGIYGHVGVVERKNNDGSILVSEMNWNGGFGKKSYRTVTNPGQYSYIH